MNETLLEIDGSHGEGGGQILRTALSLAALTGRAVHFHDIRAHRRKPGLSAQHLTCVRAADAGPRGRLSLRHGRGKRRRQRRVRRPRVADDVAAAVPGLRAERSDRRRRHAQPLSPPFDYLRDVWLKTLTRLGVEAEVDLEAWGWFPIGKGRIRVTLTGWRDAAAPRLSAFDLSERGALVAVRGRGVAANLPSHIPQRMADRALSLLSRLDCPLDIKAKRVRAACPGAGLFLTAVYENGRAGFSAIGRRGRPSEEVAEEAALALIAHHASSAALDTHLGDQILVPAAFCDAPSRFTVHRITRHLRTNAWVIERFGLAEIEIEEGADGVGCVTVRPAAPPRG